MEFVIVSGVNEAVVLVSFNIFVWGFQFLFVVVPVTVLF